MRGPFKNFKKKRCSKCKYVFKSENIFACNRTYIKPVKLICFKYKVKG